MKIPSMITENTGISITVLLAIISGIAWITTMAANVKANTTDIVAIKTTSAVDHDTLIEIKTDVKQLLKRR